MAFVTKTWKDRLVEYAGRRKLKNVATGEEILMDVSRSEGTVNQAGDAFSAANMNNLEQRIKTEFDSVNSSLVSDIYVGDDKKLHKIIGGADTVLNFSNGFSSFGQGEYKYGTLTTSLIVTSNQDYDRALMIVSGAAINISSCSTSGSGNINLIEQNVPNLQIFAFTLENIKHGDAITILSKTQARFNYSILC